MSTKWDLVTLMSLLMAVFVVLLGTTSAVRTISFARSEASPPDDVVDVDAFVVYPRPPHYSPHLQRPSMHRHTAGKRSTIMLDKIVYAFQNAFNKNRAGQGGGGGGIGGAVGVGGTSGFHSMSEDDLRPLEHRLPRDKVFWRCYFNAVSCFRRK